jgi:hypothetical protein
VTSIKDRVRRLAEARQRRRPDHLPVLTLRPGESVAEGQARAAASWFVTIGLVVPTVMDIASWEAAAVTQQSELFRHEAGLRAEHPPPPAGGHDSRNDRSGTPPVGGFTEVGGSRAVYRTAKVRR